MRHGTSSRRQRSRNNGGRRGGQKRSQVYDSNGPDVRIRGTAHQVCEKYLALAKDSTAAGNVVLAESYLQHAEHYQRIINAWEEENGRQDKGERNNNGRKEKSDNKTSGADADLSLPSSILGEEAKAESETRTAELSDA